MSFTGVIGSVGLVAPHIAKFIVGGEHGLQLPLSALIGAALVLLSDTVGRSMMSNPVIIPVGVVISIIGVSHFYLYDHEKGEKLKNMNFSIEHLKFAYKKETPLILDDISFFPSRRQDNSNHGSKSAPEKVRC